MLGQVSSIPGDQHLHSLRKQPIFSDATSGFPAKWRQRDERRNSILGNKRFNRLHLCLSIRANQALQFDGVDDHVLLPPIHTLGLTDRYLVVNSVGDVTRELLRFNFMQSSSMGIHLACIYNH